MVHNGFNERSPAVQSVCSRWGSLRPEIALRSALAERFAHVQARLESVPVDVFYLSRYVGAEISFVEMTGDGLLSTDGVGYRIAINSSASRQRQRFTCARRALWPHSFYRGPECGRC